MAPKLKRVLPQKYRVGANRSQFKKKIIYLTKKNKWKRTRQPAGIFLSVESQQQESFNPGS